MDQFYDIPLERRLEESTRMISKYPDRIPVILQRHARTQLLPLEQKKFLVPASLSIREFQRVILTRLRIDHTTSIYLFAEHVDKDGRRKHILLSSSQSAADVYQYWKNNDNFLYIYYSTEDTFG
jgi:GABA(A) receptor-associated protein